MSTDTTTRGLACTVSRGRITWLCCGCGEPIKATTGYLTVNDGLAYRRYHDEEEREYQRRVKEHAVGHPIAIPASDLWDAPPSVKWQALHYECDQHPERDADYWFGVERANTLASVINWSAHLMGKIWIGQTDWDHVGLSMIFPGAGHLYLDRVGPGVAIILTNFAAWVLTLMLLVGGIGAGFLLVALIWIGSVKSAYKGALATQETVDQAGPQ